MFCYQCEQTAKGTGCTQFGVCGKDPEVAALQDLLIHATKGISMYAHRAGKLGARDHEVDRFVIETLFTTVTNVNFDAARLEKLLHKASKVKAKAAALYQDAVVKSGNLAEPLAGPAMWNLAAKRDDLVKEGEEVGIETRRSALGEDISGLQELLTYGLKGTAAYAEHARILGKEDPDVYAFFHDALDFLAKDKPSVNDLLGYNLK